jgi:hypothetical protein
MRPDNNMILMTSAEQKIIFAKATAFPEHFKILQIKHQAHLMRQFVVWAQETKGLKVPEGIIVDHMIVEFFRINLNKISVEKERMVSIMEKTKEYIISMCKKPRENSP